MRVFFQDPATGLMEGIIDLHNSIMYYIVIVVTLVGWMLFIIVYDFGYKLYVGNNNIEDILKTRKEIVVLNTIIHGRLLEIIWTITPSFILIAIAVPSLSLLYAMDELIEPTVTLKVLGHQWYWSYEYTDFEGTIGFDSYMLGEDDLEEGDLRLLEVDRKVWLPTETNIRVLVTASDVLHCWALPAMGVKVDAVPGRLNQTSMYIKREGTFYGQCSEICGVNHGLCQYA